MELAELDLYTEEIKEALLVVKQKKKLSKETYEVI
jgi:hypothetical protein